MANISQVSISDNTYNIKDNYFDHFYEVKGNNDDVAGTWTLREDRITAYTEGLVILYTITVAGGNNSTTLNISSYNSAADEVISLGSKPIYLQNGEALKTQYSVGKSIFLRYSSLLGVSTGAWYVVNPMPTKTSDITNDSGYITNSVSDLTYYTKTSDLATVAMSGSYNDLNNKPTIDTNISTSSTNPVQNKAIPNYISSRAQQLITNGSVTLCNNYNFSSFTYDGVYSNASGGSFSLSNQATPSTDELMPVTKGKIYTLKYDLYPNYDFSTSGAVVAGINGFLPYLDQYDIDGNKIADTNTNYKDGTLVRLTQDLVSGATTAYVESTASFAAINGTTKIIQVWDYTNNNGYTWPAGTYTRHSFNISAFDTTNNTLTLVNAHSGATIPAGTYISQNRGGGYAYIGSYMKPAPNVWTTCTATTTASTIRYGCAFAKIGWLWNYNVSNSQATTWSSTEAYAEGRGVKNGTIYYISKKAVPAGIDITNTDYWFTKNATSLVANVVTRMTNVSFTENGIPGTSGLTTNKFVIGNGNSSIKISSMEPTTSATTWSDSSDIYVPTMKAISNQFVKGSSLTNNYLTLGSGGRNVKASSYAPASSATTWDTNSDAYLPTMKSISSWGSPKAGSSSITTVGTITSGKWNGTAIGDSYISSASTWNAKLGQSDITNNINATTQSDSKVLSATGARMLNAGSIIRTYSVASSGVYFKRRDAYGNILTEITTDISSSYSNNNWGILYEYFRETIFNLARYVENGSYPEEGNGNKPIACIGLFIPDNGSAISDGTWMSTKLKSFFTQSGVQASNIDSFEVKALGGQYSVAECTIKITMWTKTAKEYTLVINANHAENPTYTTEGWICIKDSKQNTLVSGTNIKTINNTSILGSGNIEIQSGGIELIDSIKYQDTVEALSLGSALLMDSNTYSSVETFYIELVSSSDIWQGSSPIISTFLVTSDIPYIFTVTVFTTNIETLTFKVDHIYELDEYFIAISCIDYLSKLWLDRINIYKVS